MESFVPEAPDFQSLSRGGIYSLPPLECKPDHLLLCSCFVVLFCLGTTAVVFRGSVSSEFRVISGSI